MVAQGYYQLGIVALTTGNLQVADDFFRKSLEISERIDEPEQPRRPITR
jgi:hypothetical protein